MIDIQKYLQLKELERVTITHVEAAEGEEETDDYLVAYPNYDPMTGERGDDTVNMISLDEYITVRDNLNTFIADCEAV